MQMAAEVKERNRVAQQEEDARKLHEAAESQRILREAAEKEQAGKDYGDFKDFKAQEEAEMIDYLRMQETIRENDEAERVSEDLVKKVKLDRYKKNQK